MIVLLHLLPDKYSVLQGELPTRYPYAQMLLAPSTSFLRALVHQPLIVQLRLQ